MNRKLEQSYPYLVALAVSGAAHYGTVKFPKGENILSASITMGAIFTGFLATAKSILISLQGKGFEQLKKTPFFGVLVDYLKEAIWLSMVYCMISLVGFFLDTNAYPAWFTSLWFFFTVSSILAFSRIIGVLLQIIRL